MSAILGCNTDFTFLGSESAARCAACYVLKYITKNPSELASTVALVYKARIAVKNHPSKAEDSGSNIRTAIHFLNSILNRINGLEEVSAQMAAAAVIGMSFDTVTHDFQLTFVTAAMAYAKREIEERNKKTPLTLLDEFGTVDADEDIMEWEEDVNEETDGTEFNDENSPNISCTPDAEFEPFQSENAKEREAWGENEGYCTSPIYTGLTGRIACPQHIHYVHRENSFLDYSLYEYAGLVKVLPKSPSIKKKERTNKEDTQQTSEDPVLREAKTKEQTVTNHRGRASNGSFLFNVKHPLFTTHVQQIRSKHFIPIPIGIPPCPPGKRRSTMTEAWMQQARKFARYILILFRPWNEDGGRLPGPLTWKALCEFLRDLRNGPDGKGPTILGRVRLAWISNMSRGLRMTTIKRVAASRYRMRSATVLGKPDGTSAIVKPIDEDRNDASFAYDEQSKDERDRSNDRKFDPNDPNTAIEMLRSEAAADDLLHRENEKEIAFHEATLKNLDTVMGHDAAQTPQSPLSQSTVQRLLYTSAPPNTSFEQIIAELSSPVPPKQIDSNDHQLDPMCSKKRDFHIIDPKNATLESMNDGQKASYKLIGDYLIAEANSRKGLGPKPLPPRLFIDGGPGTGKTYLINCIKQNAENVGLSVMTCAYTGSAVDNLPKGARTIHNLFGFRVADPNAETDYQLGPKQKKLVDLRKNINLSTVCMLIIDEISYVSSKFFGRIEKRMREIMAQKNLPFGGLAVVIVGDMFQFSPVEGTALYTSTVDLFLRNKQMDPATTSGVQYFVTFRKISLDQQMRVTDDQKHMAIIKKLRTVNPPMTDILQEIERDYQILTRDLILSNPLFSWSPIVVTSNNERNSINNKQSKMFALKHNTRRFSWQETIFGTNITKIEAKQQEINLLYLNDKSLTRYFVEGAPGFITENIKPERGLVNSTQITYHSLVLNENEDRERIAEQLMFSTTDEDICLQYPPLYINVLVNNADPADFIGMTLTTGSVVIPIPILETGSPHKGFIPSKPTKILFYSRSHNVDFQFAKTFHKMQGQTCARVIVDLNDRPFCPHVTYSGFLVSLSRVKNHLHWCRMPDQPGNSGLQYLKKIRPHPDLVTWLHSYDTNGYWQKSLCVFSIDNPPPKTKIERKKRCSLVQKKRKAKVEADNTDGSSPKLQRIEKRKKRKSSE